RVTLVSVPSQRSEVNQRGPRTVAAAYLPRVRKLPFPSPQTCRTTVAEARLALRVFRFGQALKSPLASRSSTIGLPFSLPRTRTKAAVAPSAGVTLTLPSVDVSSTEPSVTSTVFPNGIVPPGNGGPPTVPVPVIVPVGTV